MADLPWHGVWNFVELGIGLCALNRVGIASVARATPRRTDKWRRVVHGQQEHELSAVRASSSVMYGPCNCAAPSKAYTDKSKYEEFCTKVPHMRTGRVSRMEDVRSNCRRFEASSSSSGKFLMTWTSFSSNFHANFRGICMHAAIYLLPSPPSKIGSRKRFRGRRRLLITDYFSGTNLLLACTALYALVRAACWGHRWCLAGVVGGGYSYVIGARLKYTWLATCWAVFTDMWACGLRPGRHGHTHALCWSSSPADHLDRRT